MRSKGYKKKLLTLNMVYYSKISIGLLSFIFIVLFGPFIPILFDEELSIEVLIVLFFMMVLFGFILHMFLNTKYFIEGDELKVQCGFIKYKPFKIKSMKKISKTNNIISSPAVSFDRIEITYGKFDEIILSPKDKHKFADDLLKINPDIINNL